MQNGTSAAFCIVQDEAAAPDKAQVADGAAAAPGAEVEEAPGFFSVFFSEMFSPIDGLFILLAFFTAYKVGSGQMGD